MHQNSALYAVKNAEYRCPTARSLIDVGDDSIDNTCIKTTVCKLDYKAIHALHPPVDEMFKLCTLSRDLRASKKYVKCN